MQGGVQWSGFLMIQRLIAIVQSNDQIIVTGLLLSEDL